MVATKQMCKWWFSQTVRSRGELILHLAHQRIPKEIGKVFAEIF